MSIRGLRNNNPGNIKRSAIVWDGQTAPEDMTPEQRDEDTFVVFRAPWWGIRAMAKILVNYQRKHGLKTIRRVIGRWAPDSDNNPTPHYVRFVAQHMNVPADEQLDLEDFEDLLPLVKAICWFECGLNILTDPYSWEYTVGLILAGVEPTTDYLKT